MPAAFTNALWWLAGILFCGIYVYGLIPQRIQSSALDAEDIDLDDEPACADESSDEFLARMRVQEFSQREDSQWSANFDNEDD